jgi:hypothetical protein
MPRLAGSYDLTDDGRLDMQIASGIGQGIGRFIERRREAKEADRLRAEEEKRQETDALIVRILHQSQLNDWDGKHTLQALMQIPGYINSTFAKQQALRAMQPPQDIYGKVPGEYRYLNEEERRNAALRKTGQGSSSGGKRVIDFWDKYGNKHKKLVTDDNFNDVIQSIIESGGRLEEDSLTKELSYWQTSLQKTLDPLGDVLPGQEETAALANERISILRNMIRGKSLPAEQPQLQGDMTEQQAVDRATQAVERSKQVIEIGEQFPIKPFIDKIPETVKVGKLDKVKSVQAIQNAMVEYANVLVQQYGLTDFEAQREAERQVRLLQEKDGNRFGFREFPEQEIYYPQDRAGSPPAVGQTDMIARDRSQVDMTEQQADTQQQAIEPETIDEFWKKGLDRLEDEHAGLASSDAMENFKKEFVDYATKKLGMTKEQAEGEFIIRWVEGRNKRSFWRDDVLPNLPGEISKDKIMVYSPTGEMGVIPRKQLKEAIKQGYRLVR